MPGFMLVLDVSSCRCTGVGYVHLSCDTTANNSIKMLECMYRSMLLQQRSTSPMYIYNSWKHLDGPPQKYTGIQYRLVYRHLTVDLFGWKPDQCNNVHTYMLDVRSFIYILHPKTM